MNVEKVVEYWLEAAEEDWPVVHHLFESRDYHYALFFGHLYLEKLLKALVVQNTEEHAPRTHSLLYLAERAGLTVSEDRREVLLRVTGYNIETRYPEDIAVARKRYTPEYTEGEIQIIREVGEWLKSELNQEKT